MLWLTYSWEDNKDQDVDYIVNQLLDAGIEVRLDRVALGAGEHIWDQISENIGDPNRSTAWAIFATPSSFNSTACREEYHLALHRALSTRGQNFPIFGLFPTEYIKEILPLPLQNRLAVIVGEEGWIERIRAAVAGEAPALKLEQVPRIQIKGQRTPTQKFLEVRVRLGRLYPFVVGVLEGEKGQIGGVIQGPAGAVPAASATSISELSAGGFHFTIVHHAITSTDSCYIELKGIPSKIIIGERGVDLIRHEASFDAAEIAGLF